jgi:neutral ceramidase
MKYLNTLLAGCSTVDITPSPGSLMAAFPKGKGKIPRRAESIHDSICAKVIVFDDLRDTVVLVSCDLTMIQNKDTKIIRRDIHAIVPKIRQENIHIGATHTHSGPESTYLFGNNEHDPWIKEMRQKICEAVISAYNSRVPVKIGSDKIDVPQNYNRRVISNGRIDIALSKPSVINGLNPVDHEMGIIRVDRMDDSPLAVIINYTAHALCMGKESMDFSADFPGAACRYVESTLGNNSITMFFNGAAGNIHPDVCMQSEFEKMEAYGRDIGKKALEIWEKISTTNVRKLIFETLELSFANRIDACFTTIVEMAVLVLNDICISLFPGELFVQFQQELKRRSPYKKTYLFGYFNDYAGYVPTCNDYADGGYGVDIYPYDPPQLSRTRLPCGSGEVMINRVIDIIKYINNNRTQM